MQKAPKAFAPVAYTPSDVQAFQMLAQGECPPHLQKQALDYMITSVCMTYDQSYMESDRDTAFCEGRRFCGNTLVKMLKLNAKQLRSENEPSENI